MRKDCIPAKLGEVDKHGYRRISVGGLRVHAHRYVWMLFKGAIPSGKIIRHSCDNPPCINPDHLLIGTHLDNKSDSIARDRHVYGQRHGAAKITEAQAKKILSMIENGSRPCDISSHFNLSKHIVHDLKRGKTWKHIPR